MPGTQQAEAGNAGWSEAGTDAWRVRGSLNIDEFLELLGLDGRVDLSAEGCQTVSGFVADQPGRKPEPGDTCQWQGFEVRVEEIAGLRVQLVHAVWN
jgi:CBS domain containing-hemolysin-like protein